MPVWDAKGNIIAKRGARTTNCQILYEEVDFGEKLLDDDSSQTHQKTRAGGRLLGCG